MISLIKTYIAQMLFKRLKSIGVQERKGVRKFCTCKAPEQHGVMHNKRGSGPKRSGLSMIEMMVAIVIVSMFAMLAQISLYGLLRKNTFRGQIQEFISTMQMAVNSAAESDKRYEVIIDISEQYYLLREITTPDLTVVLEEEIIIENEFSDNCYVGSVEFDDLTGTGASDSDTITLQAKFRAGHNGWQNGGKIVFYDENDKEYTIVVNRLNRTVVLKEGYVELLLPIAKDNMSF